MSKKRLPCNIEISVPCQQQWEDDKDSSVLSLWMPSFAVMPSFSGPTVP